jgi:hypothetical protein
MQLNTRTFTMGMGSEFTVASDDGISGAARIRYRSEALLTDSSQTNSPAKVRVVISGSHTSGFDGKTKHEPFNQIRIRGDGSVLDTDKLDTMKARARLRSIGQTVVMGFDPDFGQFRRVPAVRDEDELEQDQSLSGSQVP